MAQKVRSSGRRLLQLLLQIARRFKTQHGGSTPWSESTTAPTWWTRFPMVRSENWFHTFLASTQLLQKTPVHPVISPFLQLCQSPLLQAAHQRTTTSLLRVYWREVRERCRLTQAEPQLKPASQVMVVTAHMARHGLAT